jgi:glycosyltransferase involved in cell wall biosynthesis
MNYQQLKTKGVLAAKTAVRVFLGNTSCYLSCIGLVPKPSRKNGISVMIRTRNEEEWIELSLLSIKDFADEIVVVDASTDRTPEIVEDVISKYELNIKHIHYEPLYPDTYMLRQVDYVNQSNIALKNTSFKWVLRWDGDFVARTSGKYSIMNLHEKILNMNPKIYHVVSIPVINLEGDVSHQRRDAEMNIEGRLITYSEHLRYEDRGRFEVLHIPFYHKPDFKFIFKREFYIFHMNTLKNAQNLLFRRFWTDWRELNDYNRFPILDDYVAYRIKKDWNIDNLDDAARYYVNEILCKSLMPYDKEQFGKYPELLKKELENPGYKVIYKDGKIIGRNDTLQGGER